MADDDKFASLVNELNKSPSPEIKKLVDLILSVGMQAFEGITRNQSLIAQQQASNFKKLEMDSKYDILRGELDMSIIASVKSIDERLKTIENSSIRSPEIEKIEKLEKELKVQQDEFKEFKPTLLNLQAWEQGSIVRWFKNRFPKGGNDSHDR